MLLYVGMTIWVFIILLMGLRPDAIKSAECWPDFPDNSVARSNKRIVTLLTMLDFINMPIIISGFLSPMM